MLLDEDQTFTGWKIEAGLVSIHIYATEPELELYTGLLTRRAVIKLFLTGLSEKSSHSIQLI